MKVSKDIFLDATRKKQMEYIWDSLDEIHLCVKGDKKKRYAITAVSGFAGGCVVMIVMQFKLLWKQIIGG